MGTSCICLENNNEKKKLVGINKKNEEEQKYLANMNKKIEDYCKEMDEKINYYGEKINDLKNSLEFKKKKIILKINESDDFMNNEISEFYKLLNQNPENSYPIIFAVIRSSPANELNCMTSNLSTRYVLVYS